jgi:hypothetical protein
MVILTKILLKFALPLLNNIKGGLEMQEKRNNLSCLATHYQNFFRTTKSAQKPFGEPIKAAHLN